MSILGNFVKATAVSIIAVGCAYADSTSSAGFQHSSLVGYSDLNLDRQQDVGRLYTRISVAADKLCGPRSLTGIHYKWADYMSCYHETVAQTVASVGHPELSAYAQQHSRETIAREVSFAR